jgi:lipid II:glycine glycyltransferase (peptidoglycan interpeptide bridge formation enzyme)
LRNSHEKIALKPRSARVHGQGSLSVTEVGGNASLDDDAAWDAFLLETHGGELAQSSAWAGFKRACGMHITRVIETDSCGIVGGAQLIVRRLPLVGSVAYVPYGPVMRCDATASAQDSVVRRVVEYCESERIRALFIQPPEGGELAAVALRTCRFETSHVDVAPSATLRVDLRGSEEEVLGRMAKHTRKDMQRGMRDPLEVREGDAADLGAFYELYCATSRRQAFPPLPLHYLERLWSHLAPGGHVGLLLASHEGVDVAANLVTYFGNTVTGRLSGFDPDRMTGRMRPNELLVWTHIQLARKRGIEVLDVGGVDRAVALRELAGEATDLHKIGYGGNPVLFPEPVQHIDSRVVRIGQRALASARMRKIRTAVHYRARRGRAK